MASAVNQVNGVTIRVRSPAKINWNLRVIARRADGFHEIESLVSTVTLYDELAFTGRADSTIELLCDHPAVPKDRGNLIARAAALLSERSGAGGGVTCRLEKRIPIGGGLGGGSSNAAGTLLALNRLWRLDWPAERLLPLAAELGSDVPLFVEPGSAIIRGRGERVERIALGWRGWLALVLPPLSISTADVYRAWSPEPESALGPVVPDTRDANTLMGQTFNMLERPAMRVVPELGPLLGRLESLAGRCVRMSGSGSSLFTAFDTCAEAESFAGRLRQQEPQLETCLVQLMDGA